MQQENRTVDIGTFTADVDVQLNDGAIYTEDRGWLYPSKTNAYIECFLSHSFPTVFAFGCCLHPATVARSYLSLRDQNVNIGHIIRAYDPEGTARDRIIGSVVSVGFPPAPSLNQPSQSQVESSGVWQVTAGTPPGIRAVMSIFKQASGVDRILGQQQSGRKKWSVSVEYTYSLAESGFLVQNDDNIKSSVATELLRAQDTPKDFMSLGWWYVPVAKASKELNDCWDRKKGMIARKWKGANTLLLQGGLTGNIDYMGIALTDKPAEPTAELGAVLAEKPKELQVMQPMQLFCDFAKNILTNAE